MPKDADNQPGGRKDAAPGVGDILRAYLFLGLTAYGGPAMIPVVRRHIVECKRWLTEEDFRLGLALCQTLPGATVMQHAAYVGLRLRGKLGALAAYAGFALPAFGLITGLSMLYMRYGNSVVGGRLLSGLQIAVLALLWRAGWDFARRFARSGGGLVLMLLAGALFLLSVGPVPIIIGSAALGAFFLREQGGQLSGRAQRGPSVRPRFLLISVLVLATLLAALSLWGRTCFELALTMLKVDLVAFGVGAFPVMQHEVVEVRGWMTQEMFFDGIALGQMTPGPVLMTAAFVGYVLSGLPGAAVAAVSVLTPSFFLLLIAVPCSERLLASKRFRRALQGALATLGGLLFAMTVTLGLRIAWTPTKALLEAGVFAALALGFGVHWVLLAVAAASLVVF
jgi:chromate transporter